MNKFVVSCQALEHEPLHSSYIMGRMAKAAKEGGAQVIRANTVDDIKEIKKQIDLPIIGIIKKDYFDCKVYITPTIVEVDALVQEEVDIIAIDATISQRPDGSSLEQFFTLLKTNYPNQKWMADCSTFEEMRHADELGFDYVSTTLFGYTEHSNESAFVDLNRLQEETKLIKSKLVAEGQINTPELAAQVAKLKRFDLIVIGSAITRPQIITRGFYEGINYEAN